MATIDIPADVAPGDPISAGDWNKLLAYLRRSRPLVGSGAGLKLSSSPFGTAYQVGRTSKGTLAYTTSTISARASTTVGSGTVYLCSTDGATITQDTAASITVLNFSGVAVSSSLYCWIEQDPDGWWWLVSVECAPA